MLAHVACPRFVLCTHTVTSSLAIMPTQRLPHHVRNSTSGTQRNHTPTQLALRDSTPFPTCASGKPSPLIGFADIALPSHLCEPSGVHLSTCNVDNRRRSALCSSRFSRIGCCGGHRLGVRCSCFACEVRTCPQSPVCAGVRLQAVPGVARRVTSRCPSRYGSPEYPQSSPNLSTALWIGGAEARAVVLPTLYREIRVNWEVKTEHFSTYFPVNVKTGET